MKNQWLGSNPLLVPIEVVQRRCMDPTGLAVLMTGLTLKLIFVTARQE